MKKISTILCIIALFSTACQHEKTSQASEAHESAAENSRNSEEANKSANSADEDTKVNTYVGMFGPNKITVAIDEVDANGKLKGRSVVSGNSRPFLGTYEENDGVFHVVAKEPGTDAYDGEFDFDWDRASGTIQGKWKAFKNNTPERKYKLERRAFEYKAEVGSYPETSTKVLKVADVNNLLKQELRIMRNEIYARHGYSFKKKDMREYFDAQDWYMPMHTDIRTNLTEVEKKNVELIRRYEDYAADYYDEYGR